MEKISRSNVNNSQVRAQDFPKSGFDLSYKSRADFALGMLHVSGYQHIMPADKISGSSDVKYTFNRFVVPEISDVEVGQYNFYVPYRSLDTSFIKGIVPTELNGMSASWRTPVFSLRGLISKFMNYSEFSSNGSLQDMLDKWKSDGALDVYESLSRMLPLIDGSVGDVYNNGFVVSHREYWLNAYDTHRGAIPFNSDNLFEFLCYLLEPFFGRNSLLDTLGYVYLRRSDIRSIANYEASTGAPNGIYELIDNTNLNEYAIRAYYAIWYEHFRDPLLQKRSANLPDWRDFGSTSIIDSTSYSTFFKSVFCFLCPRFRSWTKDMFVGSMPDDISRHVFAPIFSDRVPSTATLEDEYQYLNAENSLVDSGINSAFYDLNFHDPVTGQGKKVRCPIPKAVNDSLATLDSHLYEPTILALDLRDLRKSQMLERYLKRNFYFGDEYEDRMLAHYGSVVSDNSIRRPHLLSSSVSSVNPQQEVASVGTDSTPVGTRTATAQDSAQGDAFSFFAEEFGIVITILCVRPLAQYAGVCPQNLIAQQTDFPLPEFANNNDEFGRVLEVAMSGYDSQITGNNFSWYQFGHFPYAHAYRSRVDEVHGSFLDDRQDYTFRRFFGMDSANNVPKLNSLFITCLPNLGMFADTIRLDYQGYYTADHHFYVERVLPTPVEEI